MTATRVELWYRSWCPHCNQDNLTYGGDPNDLASSDDSDVYCTHCGETYLLDEPD